MTLEEEVKQALLDDAQKLQEAIKREAALYARVHALEAALKVLEWRATQADTVLSGTVLAIIKGAL